MAVRIARESGYNGRQIPNGGHLMFSIGTTVAITILAGAAGLTAGWFLGINRKTQDKRERIIELEAQLDAAQQARADYEAEVTEHFARTGELLSRMTEDYRAVYNHLARGADELCDGAVNLPFAGLAYDAEAVDGLELGDIAQPLDYAPKKSPNEQGQLSESFGIEKEDAEADNVQPIRAIS
jgi:uncharacterized membrane-anchored protein YhcB (DUF1043 family)